ncbi:hypothetical protein KC887_08345, partial [Candidatus Kaiserbacteria bacterium]|nr:hypothetical protein [Candidatus Kaiserbacteria bacterium]
MAPDIPVVLDYIESAATAAVFTSGTISPTANGLIWVAGEVLATGGTLNITSVTDTLSGTGTWTIVQQNSTALQQHTAFIAYALAGSSPGSGTITVNVGTNSIRTVVVFGETTSIDTSTLVHQATSGAGEADTLEITFGSSMASDSQVLAICASRTNNTDPDVQPGTGFSELIEPYSGGSFAQANSCVVYDASGADTTVDWSSLPTLTNIGVAIEIAAAGGGTQTVTATGISSQETFGGQSVAPGAVAVSPSGVVSVEAFGTTVVSAGGIVVVPGGITSEELFGSQTLSLGATTLLANAIASSEAFGTHTLSQGAVALIANAISSQEAFGTAVVAPGGVLLFPGAIASGEAFGTAVFDFSTILGTSSIASGEAFGTAVILPGAVLLLPTAIASGEAVGRHTLTAGVVSLIANAVASAETFGSTTLDFSTILGASSI